jgi:phage tail-like protein
MRRVAAAVGVAASLGFAAQAGAQVASFRVEVDGIPSSQFDAVEGPGIDYQILEVREGGTGLSRKVPGAKKFPDVILKKSFTRGSPLYAWIQGVGGVRGAHRNASILLEDGGGRLLARLSLSRCLPRQWKVTGLTAGRVAAMEELTITCESVAEEAAERPRVRPRRLPRAP